MIDDEVRKLKNSIEVVLKSLMDAGLIQSWYFNGEGYHALLKANSPYVEIADLNDQIKKKDEEIMALKKVIEMADAQYFKMRHSYEKEALENQKCLRGIK